MNVIYKDESIIVVVKEPGLLSTDEPGGVPDAVREYLGNPKADVRTVHRLDRVVGGLMVLALTPEAASYLSREIREDRFEKEYLAVLHGAPEQPAGRLRDYLARNPAERKTYVVNQPGKDAREALLDYVALSETDNLTLVRIHLITGRTHQIRAQFSSRGLPLWGDRKYSLLQDEGTIALWSCMLNFTHPSTHKSMHFELEPPDHAPWSLFRNA